MTKLVIQIPCYNEEQTLPITLASLPTSLPGIDQVEWLVIDDGSTDGTATVARAHGVNHVVVLPRHQGLAKAFLAGLDASLNRGADIVVNTDADNQYCAEDIPALIAPILAGHAELVVGTRPIATVEHFSWTKKRLQRLGSWVTRKISNTEVQDAASGFRAMSREAARRLHVFNDYTYTIETIIQAGLKGMAVASVAVRTNHHLRQSRLIRGLWSYLSRQVLTMVRVFMTYRPFPFFAVPGALMVGIGFLISLRFLYFYFTVGGQGHVQSLILAALLMGLGFFLVVIGLIADLIAVNRALLEGIDWRVRRVEEMGLTDERRAGHWSSSYEAPGDRRCGH
jgi:glycosyltransferase involved in cell wall biosynthesis